MKTHTHGHALTRAGEDYLEAIYRLVERNDNPAEGVRSVDVAELLGVSKASVNKALSSLKDEGMVEQSRYSKVTLTRKGLSYAKIVWQAHRALRAFLISDLGVDEAVADNEACLMEHVLSEETMRRWINYLEKQGITIEA